MVRRLFLAVFLLASCLALSGASNTYKGRYTGSARSYSSVGMPAAPETLSYLIRSKEAPPDSSVGRGWIGADGAYDVIVSADDGSAVKYGYIRTSLPDSVWYRGDDRDYQIVARGHSNEDGTTFSAIGGFVWFSLGDVPQGRRIENAYIYLARSPFAALTVPADGYIAVRADTIDADYAMLNHTIAEAPYSQADSNRMAFTWNDVDKVAETAWVPPLDGVGARNDLHDFGPRSEILEGPYTWEVGSPIRLDVTDAVQQVVDAGDAARGIIFYVYGIDTGNIEISSGIDAFWGRDNPALTFDAISPRGTMAWGDGKAKVALTWDDNYPVQTGIYDKVDSAGYKFTLMNYSNAHDAYDAWGDSIYKIKPQSLEIVHHSKTHTMLGTLTGNPLYNELTRHYIVGQYTTLGDSNIVVHYAWPGGAAFKRGKDAIKGFVDFGFVSSRAAQNSGSPVGDDVPLAWDTYANMYMIESVVASNIFRDGLAPTYSIADSATIHENLTDFIDMMWTNYKSPLILYAHQTYSDASAPLDTVRDGVTAGNIVEFMEIVNGLEYANIMNYEQLVNLRRNGSVFAHPDSVFTVLDSSDYAETAWDSLHAAGYEELWITPYGDND